MAAAATTASVVADSSALDNCVGATDYLGDKYLYSARIDGSVGSAPTARRVRAARAGR